MQSAESAADTWGMETEGFLSPDDKFSPFPAGSRYAPHHSMAAGDMDPLT